jgi:hypothetical protein
MFCGFYENSCQNICQAKKGQNIFIKAQFESLKHPLQMAFVTLRYFQQTVF